MLPDPRETRTWVTTFGNLSGDDATVDRAVIAAMSPDQRIARAWELVLRHGRSIGIDYSKVKLQRTVARVRRLRDS